MNDTTVVISGNRACVVERSSVTAGTVGGRVTFNFDKSWDGFAKTLVWKGSGVTLDDTACTGVIPAEAVAQAGGHLMVGVYGTCGDTATPTVWADLGVILPGATPSGDETTDPTLPVWAQLRQQLAEQEVKCGKVKTVNGFEPDETGNVVIEGGLGEPGPQGPQGPQGAPGEPGKTPVKGVDYFTQADRQEIADQAAQLVEMPHVPQNVSAFENDAGYQTAADVEGIVAEALQDLPAGGGSGDAVEWKPIYAGKLSEPVSSIVIDAVADGTSLESLGVNELLVFGRLKLSGNSKLRFEHNGLWTPSNYASLGDFGAWHASYCVHQKKFPSGIVTEISVDDKSYTLFTNKAIHGQSYPIKFLEIHTESADVMFTVETFVNAYYR